MLRSLRHLATAAIALATLAGRAHAQGAPGAQGTITGRVVETGTQQPIADAQIFVVGTGMGGRTTADGSYRIVNVPAGTVQLRSLRIGYQAVTQTVTVTAGGTTTADFTLGASAVTLDAQVVTATGETQRRRELGNSIATIRMDSVSLAPVTNFSDLLSSRASGVTVQSSGGATGSGSRIRIRGSNSVSLSNDPLVIVDGVRLNTASTGADVSSLGVGGQEPSRFNDINPDDIENIEVVKGPAGVALYGTAAANGVIQITTKRGRSGQARWGSFIERGIVKEPTAYPANYLALGDATDSTSQCIIPDAAAGDCSIETIVSHNPLEQHSPFRTGWRENYGLNVTGGSDATTYYIAGDYEREQGVYEVSRVRRVNLRTNVRAQIRPNLDATVNVGFLSSRVQLPQNDNNLYGVVGSGTNGYAMDCSPATPCPGGDTLSRGWGAGQPPQAFDAIQTIQRVNRFTGGLNTGWQPLGWLRFSGQFGADVIGRTDEETVAPNLVLVDPDYESGYRTDNRFQIGSYTANLGATATYGLTSDLQATTQTGVQYFSENNNGNYATGFVLLPGTGSLEGTSQRFAVGNRTRSNVTIGGYVQQQLAWRDRVFASAGLRGDDNSAFGSDFGLVYYPSAQLSWVLSEESFFPQTDLVSSLRLRTAYGQSGQRPNFRDAVTYYSPIAARVGGEDLPATTVGGTGNTLLKPERSSEVEVGFEAELLKDRVSLDFSYFNKTTNDALIARRLPGSLGASNTRFENIGEVSNRGVETQLRASVVNTQPVKVDATVSASWLKNELVALGKDVSPIVIGFGQQQHQEGYSLGGFWDRPYTYEDADGNGLIGYDEITVGDEAVFLGNSIPTREVSFSPAVTLFNVVRISSLFDYRGGYKQFNSTEEFRCDTYFNCRGINDPSAPLDEQAKAVAAADQFVLSGYIEDASFVKLREVAVTFTLPQSLNGRFGVDNLALTVAGRNLGLWTDYTGLDPEINNFGQSNFSQAEFNSQPAVRYWTARIDFNF